jgi:predicted secreted Zn-dependent protease
LAILSNRCRVGGRALAAAILSAVVFAGVAGHGSAAVADVKATTVNRYYAVAGASRATLARQMRANPFRGDNGGAVANIRPKYSLDVATEQTGDICAVTNVDLNIRFVLTLPRATESAMVTQTRVAWQSFVAFARRHEEVHREIYLQCAKKFVAQAERLSGASCDALKSQASRLLEASKRACEKRNAAFDRSERQKLSSQPLLRNTATARR